MHSWWGWSKPKEEEPYFTSQQGVGTLNVVREGGLAGEGWHNMSGTPDQVAAIEKYSMLAWNRVRYCWNFVGTKKLVILHKNWERFLTWGNFSKSQRNMRNHQHFGFEILRDLSHHRAVWALEEAPFTCLCLQLTFCNAFDGESGLIVLRYFTTVDCD